VNPGQRRSGKGVDSLYGASSRKQIEDQHDDRKNKQNMNPRAYGINPDYAKQPEDEENDGDRPKHEFVLLESCPATSAIGVEIRLPAIMW
jgi:hypothetical protein